MSEKTVGEKLLLKPGQTFRVVNAPQGFEAILGKLPEGVIQETGSAPVDALLLFVHSRQELEEQLPAAKTEVQPGGIIWAAYHKGTSRIKTDINRDSLYAFALSIELQGTTLISVNDDWSALRMKPASS